MSLIKFTSYIPQSLVNVNSVSRTLAAEPITGLPLSTGARPGGSFYVSAPQAVLFSTPTQPVYAGWYREVQVAATATAANIFAGAIGALNSLGSSGLFPSDEVVTSYDAALATGLAPVVFLGPVTPGNYTYVQHAGDASVFVNATVTAGTLLTAVTTGNGQAAPAAATLTSFAQIASIIGMAEASRTGAGIVRTRLSLQFGQNL